MNKIIKKLNYSLILVVCSFFLIQCKSVEFTFLGFFNKKYTNQSLESKEIMDVDNSKLSYKKNDLAIISGFVSDTNTNPVKNAEINLIRNNQTIAYSISDENGFFQFANLNLNDTNFQLDKINNKFVGNKNDYKITITADGFQNEMQSIVINPNDNIQTNFILKQMCCITGIVIKPDRSPLSDILVLLKNDEGKLSISKTNQTGHFIFNQLQKGKYSISISHNQYSFTSKIIELENACEKKYVEFISGACKIYGTIKTDNNSEVKNTLITLQRIDLNNTDQSFLIIDSTLSNGKYNFDGLNQGKYKVQIYLTGFGVINEIVDVYEDKMQKKKDFVLSKQGFISGTLNNYAIDDNIDFFLIDQNNNAYKTKDVEIRKDGTYRINGISAGIYNIILKWKNILITKQSVTVIKDKETVDINLNLKEEIGSISGRILSKSDNKPIENALIIVSNDITGNYALTDKEGFYKINGLSNGKLKIQINALNYKTLFNDLLLEKNKVFSKIDYNLEKSK